MSKEALTLLFGRVIIQYHTINIYNKAIYKKLTQKLKKMVIIMKSPLMPRAGYAIKNKLSDRTRTDTNDKTVVGIKSSKLVYVQVLYPKVVSTFVRVARRDHHNGY